MALFVKTDIITLDNTEIEVREIGVDYLLLSDVEKADTKKILELHTSLTKEQIQNLTIEAFQTILNAFYDLNSEHYSEKTTSSTCKEDEGK